MATVAELWRHPVKSMQGERLTQATVLETGVAHDRTWAVKNDQDGKILTGRRTPALLDAAARVGEDGGPLITLPDGSEVGGLSPSTDEALSSWLGQPVRVVSSSQEPARQIEMYEDATDDTSGGRGLDDANDDVRRRGAAVARHHGFAAHGEATPSAGPVDTAALSAERGHRHRRHRLGRRQMAGTRDPPRAGRPPRQHSLHALFDGDAIPTPTRSRRRRVQDTSEGARHPVRVVGVGASAGNDRSRGQRKALFVNAGFTRRFEDMTVAESQPFLRGARLRRSDTHHAPRDRPRR